MPKNLGCSIDNRINIPLRTVFLYTVGIIVSSIVGIVLVNIGIAKIKSNLHSNMLSTQQLAKKASVECSQIVRQMKTEEKYLTDKISLLEKQARNADHNTNISMATSFDVLEKSWQSVETLKSALTNEMKDFMRRKRNYESKIIDLENDLRAALDRVLEMEIEALSLKEANSEFQSQQNHLRDQLQQQESKLEKMVDKEDLMRLDFEKLTRLNDELKQNIFDLQVDLKSAEATLLNLSPSNATEILAVCEFQMSLMVNSANELELCKARSLLGPSLSFLESVLDIGAHKLTFTDIEQYKSVPALSKSYLGYIGNTSSLDCNCSCSHNACSHSRRRTVVFGESSGSIAVTQQLQQQVDVDEEEEEDGDPPGIDDSNLNQIEARQSTQSSNDSFTDLPDISKTSEAPMLPDFAWRRRGGRVVHEYTSATYLSAHSLSRVLPRRLLGMELGQGAPEDALSDDMREASCWPMRGSRGMITIKLAMPIRVEFISIAHLSRYNILDGRSAPHHFRVYGATFLEQLVDPLDPDRLLVEGVYEPVETEQNTKQYFRISNKRDYMDNENANTKSEMGNTDTNCSNDDNMECDSSGGNDSNNVTVGLSVNQQNTSNDNPHHMSSQTINMTVVQYLTFEIISNHGHPDYTCLYRLGVHGRIFVSPAQSQ